MGLSFPQLKWPQIPYKLHRRHKHKPTLRRVKYISTFFSYILAFENWVNFSYKVLISSTNLLCLDTRHELALVSLRTQFVLIIRLWVILPFPPSCFQTRLPVLKTLQPDPGLTETDNFNNTSCTACYFKDRSLIVHWGWGSGEKKEGGSWKNVTRSGTPKSVCLKDWGPGLKKDFEFMRGVETFVWY